MAALEHPAALAGPTIDWHRLTRVLVIRADNLGDVVLSGPALRALRHAAPHARLDLLAAPVGAEVAPLLPEVDRVLTASVSWQRVGREDLPVGEDLDPVGRVRRGRYQAAVVLTSFSQSPWPAGYMCRLAGVPVRVGMSKEFGGAALTHWVPSAPDHMHQADRGLHLLQRVGVPPVDGRLRLRVPDTAISAARDVLATAGLPVGAPYALVLPGASCPARRYPPERLATVASRLADDLPVVVAGTAREAELVTQVAGAVPGTVALPGRLDVPALAAVVAGSAVVVCNNSGGAHVASAVGTPVVVLSAGTEQPEQYRPRFGPATVFTKATSCAPCRQFSCPYGQECLDVAPGRVAEAALRLAAEVNEARGRAPPPTPQSGGR